MKQVIVVVIAALMAVKVNAVDLGKIAPVQGTPYASQKVNTLKDEVNWSVTFVNNGTCMVEQAMQVQVRKAAWLPTLAPYAMAGATAGGAYLISQMGPLVNNTTAATACATATIPGGNLPVPPVTPGRP
jgi:hypothetical protein